jgi:hypothetical protein
LLGAVYLVGAKEMLVTIDENSDYTHRPLPPSLWQPVRTRESPEQAMV